METMEKKNGRDVFVFQTAWREILATYPSSVRLEVYDAVMDYAATGEVPELKPLAKMAFSFIKADIDRREAVQKELLDALYADAGDDGRKRKKVRRGRKSKRDRQDGGDDAEGGSSTSAGLSDFHPGQNREETAASDKGDVMDFVARRWNAVCGDNMGLPKVSALTASRRKKLRRRIKEWTKNFKENITDVMARLFAAIRQSEFLRGKNRFGWRVTFDWIVRNATNALKVLEGQYKACERRQERPRCARDRADFGMGSAAAGASWSPIMSIMQ